MKTRLIKILRITVALIVVLVVLSLVGDVIYGIGRVLLSIKTDLAVAIIAASATVFVSVISVLISKHLENKFFLRRELREKKIPVYEEIMEAMFEVIYSNKNDKVSNQTSKKLTGFVPKLITWGSDPVTKAFSDFRTVVVKKQDDNRLIAFALANLMLEMRKDLGHSNNGLTHEGILRIFINDPVAVLQLKPKVPEEKIVENQ